jgi:DNA repair photolyase
VIEQLKKEGFCCGVFLLPVIPFLTDTLEIMKRSIQDFYEAGVDYLLFGSVSLKTGRQKTYFYQMLSSHFPHLISSYGIIYKDE